MAYEVVSARQLDWKVRAPLSQNTCPHVTCVGLFELVGGQHPGLKSGHPRFRISILVTLSSSCSLVVAKVIAMTLSMFCHTRSCCKGAASGGWSSMMDAQCVVVSSSMGCEGHWWGGLPRELQGLIQICPAARVGHRSGPRIWEINVVADIV